MSSKIMPVYKRTPLGFSHGEGAWLFAENGEKYLDFSSGIAVNVLGHANPILVKALCEQAKKLWHVSNIFTIEGQEKLAEKITQNCFAERVFFGNSGTEAIEGVLKTIRRFHFAKGSPHKTEIITMEGAFHGRSLAALAASGQGKNLEGLGAPLAGFIQVPFADMGAIGRAIGKNTAAILLEPIQGEGGVRVLSHDFLQKVRVLCDHHGILLACDEIQCGMGRSGYFLASEAAGIAPDIAAIAKGLGGGFPIGAVLASKEAACGMGVGIHGSTFGGNPLAMAVGQAVLDVVLEKDFLEGVREKGGLLTEKLTPLLEKYPMLFSEVRGVGLIQGLILAPALSDQASRAFVEHLRAHYLLCVSASNHAIRLLPPLTITPPEMDEAVHIIDKAASSFTQESG